MATSPRDPGRPLYVAVVGAGPSGFYAAKSLLEAPDLDVRVHLFDRLPTPFGLVRGGVAPDHQKIKEVARLYQRILDDPRLRFFGNVRAGRDVSVDELGALYDAVIWAVGNEADRRLGVEGEDLEGVHTATSFVGWYNGHPDFRDERFDLERARRVAVVGNGNVAMDVTRILARDPRELASTDIADYALEALRRSGVREILLLGRRGPAQAAFSPKEMRELCELEGVDVLVDPADLELDPVTQAWLDSGKAPATARQNLEVLRAQAERGATGAERRVVCKFLVSPKRFLGEEGRVRAVELERNRLVAGEDGVPRARGTGETFVEPVDLVLEAIGYRGVPVPGLPFDERRGVIPNEGGRVLRAPGSSERLPGHYVVGWAKRGPTGLIGSNLPDARATVAALLQDLAGEPSRDRENPEPVLLERLRARGVDVVDEQDWKRLDAFEVEEGRKRGKPRQKLTDVGEMLRVVRSLRELERSAQRSE